MQESTVEMVNNAGGFVKAWQGNRDKADWAAKFKIQMKHADEIW